MKARTDEKNFAARACALAAGILTAATGLLALAGWILQLPGLASFGSGLIPMAPDTALLFALFGGVLSLRVFLPKSRLVLYAGRAVAAAGFVVAVLLFRLSCAGQHPRIERLGLSMTGDFTGGPVGHISPLTAACFALASLSLLATFFSSPNRPNRARAAFLLACLSALISFLLLIAYLFGSPVMYGGRFIPPSLPTSLAFLILSAGLALLTGERFLPRIHGEGPTARVSMTLVPVFLLLSAGIVASGYFYYRHYEKQFRTEAEHQLSAVADLKVHDLVQWRKERMGDATVFYGNENFSSRVKRLFQAPDDRENKERTRTWMRQAQDAYDYDRVCLHDVRGVERLSVPDAPVVEPDSVFSHGASNVLESGRVVFQDFYRSEEDGRIYLSVLIPIHDASQGNRAIGVLALRIDPEHYLYPLISRWPAPSRTAETLLIHREGGEVVFLNELRHQKNTALTLRFPLSKADLPAAKVVLGQEGIVEGNDYRGVPVIADVRSVPDSPWFIVAKIDRSEVYAPLRERLWILVVLIGAFLLSAGAGLGAIWRRQSLHFYQEKYEAAEALRESEAFTRMIMDNLPIGLAVNSVDPAVKFEYMNDNFPRFYRTTREALAGSDMFWEAVYEDPELRETMKKRVLEDIASGNPAQMYWEDVPITRKGEETTYVTARNTPIPEKGLMISAVWDVTERKRAEEAVTSARGFLDRIVEMSPFAMWISDQEGTLIRANQSLRNTVNLTDDQIIGKYNVLRDENLEIQGVMPLVRAVFEKHAPARFSIPWKAADAGDVDFEGGSDMYIDVSLFPILNAQGELTNVVCQWVDITERKRAEEAVRRHSEELRQKNAELERFTYTISHDLKSPLVTIKTFLGYLEKDRSDSDAGRVEQDMAYIQGAADKMGMLLDELLEMSRIGRVVNPSVTVSFHDLVEESLAAVAGRISEQNVEISVSGKKIKLHGDRSRLAEIWQNLIENAVKFMGDQAAPRIEIGVEKREKDTVFFVRDNGAGIDARYQEKVFGLFEKLDKKSEGTGLGLALVKRIVELYKGKIWLESEGIGKGSCFRFTLPEAVKKA